MKNKSKKICKKVFTKEKRRDTIKKNYNPLKVNYEIYRRGSGIYMENDESTTAKVLSKKYNRKEELILKMIEKCNEFGCSIKSIEEFCDK